MMSNYSLHTKQHNKTKERDITKVAMVLYIVSANDYSMAVNIHTF
jgi:hypothetical protein